MAKESLDKLETDLTELEKNFFALKQTVHRQLLEADNNE